MRRPRRSSTCRVGTIRSRVFRGSRVAPQADGAETRKRGGERCGYQERRVEASRVRPGRSANSEFFLGVDVIVAAATLLGRCQPTLLMNPW